MNAEYFQPRCGFTALTETSEHTKFRKGIAVSLSPFSWDNTLTLLDDMVIVSTAVNKYYWRFLNISNWRIRALWHRQFECKYSSNPELVAAICTGLVVCKLFKALKDLA